MKYLILSTDEDTNAENGYDLTEFIGKILINTKRCDCGKCSAIFGNIQGYTIFHHDGLFMFHLDQLKLME